MSLYKTLFETPENKLKVGIIGMVIITSLLAAVFYSEAQSTDVMDLADIQKISIDGNRGNVELRESSISNSFSNSDSGITNENSEEVINIEITQEMLLEISCVLTWEDGPSSYFRGTNDPDNLQLKLQAPSGDAWDSGYQTNSPITISAPIPDYSEKDFEDKYIGSWAITVNVGDCGDDSSIGGFRTTPDTGNDWTLSYTIKFMEEVETEN